MLSVHVHVCIRICTCILCLCILCSDTYICALFSPAHVISQRHCQKASQMIAVAMYTDGSLVADCGFTDNIVQGPVCACVLAVFPPRINEKGGGGFSGTQSVKLYLGAWCMYILHLKSR